MSLRYIFKKAIGLATPQDHRNHAVALLEAGMVESHRQLYDRGSSKSRADYIKALKAEPGLTDIDLSGVDLEEAFLSEVFMPGADFTGANLNKACLVNAKLAGARFAGANVSGANFYKAFLTGANLSGVRFGEGIYFFKTDVTGAIIDIPGYVALYTYGKRFEHGAPFIGFGDLVVSGPNNRLLDPEEQEELCREIRALVDKYYSAQTAAPAVIPKELSM